ncbi:MAG: GNAT family N-acetyltransferase [Candidatus Micrarchaeia archaeon]
MPERKLKPFGTRKTMLGKSALVLRPARMSDAKALNGIVNEPGVNDFLLVERPLSLQSTRKVLKDNKHPWVVSELDGKVVGSISIRPGIGRQDKVCGFGIAFSSKVHGKGVASAALRECLGWMRAQGFDNCTAQVNENNAKARKFYHKMGFREVARIPRQMRKGKRLVGLYVIQKIFR